MGGVALVGAHAMDYSLAMDDAPMPGLKTVADDALRRSLDADIARGLAELQAGDGVALDDAFRSLWAELDDGSMTTPVTTPKRTGTNRRHP